MNKILLVARSVFAIGVGVLATLIVSGLLLGLAWSLVARPAAGYKLATGLLVIALAFITGGATSGRLAGRNPARHGFAIGLLFGFLAFGYSFGPSWGLVPATLACSLLGAFGGWLVRRSLPRLQRA